ncbi:MAG TPA: peptide chain release factor 2 [Candidatus Saccharimonadales bacterium]|nr:peptide chain release factor 2 [Candidatus Saccharimonadales bacterium]
MEIEKQATQLLSGIEAALKRLDVPNRQLELKKLREQMAGADFWKDNIKAQVTVKQEATLRSKIEPWLHLQKEVADIVELSKDQSLAGELAQQLREAQQKYDVLAFDLQFSGPYDDHDAIIRLSAGVGGTDAQDWTHMLERMYLRWAEKQGFKTELIEESAGEEAGVKSATISVRGPYVFGKLKSEHGVHRLVRLSPFNADNLRQTSFALVEVLPQIDAPDEVALDEKDLKVDVFRAGGHGGQSVNTTDSAVRITHVPSGIVVSIQNERSQLQNKETALKILRSKLAQLQLEQHKEQLSELKATKSADWGAQIRNYVLHPYTLVKDTRTGHEEHDANKVLDGALDDFIQAYLRSTT